MDQYFFLMNKIVQEKKTSSRVRFKLQDVIALRKCKWIPSRHESNPKTIDQIHKEAQKEDQERQRFSQPSKAQHKTKQEKGGGARGSRGSPGSGMRASDGWNTVGKPNKRVERQSIDPSRLNITKQNLDESNIQLGPGGGTNRFSGWQRGSTGGGARNSMEQEKSNAPSNRFSALSKPEDDCRGRFGTSPARGDSRGRGSGGFGRPQSQDQIHKEAQKEEQERQIFLQQATAQQKAHGGRGGGGARGSRGPPGSGMGASDGWNTVGKPYIRVERQSIDPSRLKITKQNLDESNIQIGPGGGTNRFSGWQRGSTGGGARNSVEQEKSNAPSNRFSALSKPNDDSRGSFGTSPARGDSRGRGSGGFGRPQSRGITPRSSMEQEKEQALAAVRDVVGGQTTPRQGQSKESSRGREPYRVEIEKSSKTAPPTAKELTDEEMEKKTKTILDEYLHLQDIKEAILCVEELKSPSVMHTFVSSAVNYVLERSNIARNQTGLLLHDLVKKNVLSVPEYIQGLTEVIQYAEDMEIEIPKIWQYFGELIGPMVQDGSFPLNFLRKAAEPLKENNKAGLLVAEVLHAASHREGHKKVGSLWRQSSLQWEDFMPAGDVKKFIVDKKVEFTAGDDSQPSTPTVLIYMEAIQDKLHRLLIKDISDNEVD